MPDDHATGILEGKIDGLLSAVEISRKETTFQLNRLSDKLDAATVSVGHAKGTQVALQKQLDAHEADDRRSFGRVWQIIIGAGVVSGSGLGIAKMAQGFLG